MEPDSVNHPAHYGGESDPYEAIKVIEAWGLGFHLGNAVKYIARAGKKGDMREDLRKARWYIDRLLAVPEKEAERVPEDAGGDPEARVRAMSGEEVEAALAGRGVSGWRYSGLGGRKMHRYCGDGWDAIDPDGIVYHPELRTAYDFTRGDTTTEVGRMECSRRLLVHLLRDEADRA